jgi:hypothetical protein
VFVDSDETFQVYSTFTTNNKNPDEYEALLVAASKMRAQAVKAYQRREPKESALVCIFLILRNYPTTQLDTNADTVESFYGRLLRLHYL